MQKYVWFELSVAFRPACSTFSGILEQTSFLRPSFFLGGRKLERIELNLFKVPLMVEVLTSALMDWLLTCLQRS